MFVCGKYGDTYMGIVRTALLILRTLFHYVLFNQKQIGIQILLDLALPYDLPCFQTFLLLNILLSLEVGHSTKYTRLGDKHCQKHYGLEG